MILVSCAAVLIFRYRLAFKYRSMFAYIKRNSIGAVNRSFSLSRNKKNKSKTIQWIKSRNCDITENK